MRGLELSRDSRVNQSTGIRERKIFSVSLYGSTGSLSFFRYRRLSRRLKISTVASVRWKMRTRCENPITRVWRMVEPRASLNSYTTSPSINSALFAPRTRSMGNRSPRRPLKVNFLFFFVVWCKWFLNTRLLDENLGYSGWTCCICGKFEGARMHGRHRVSKDT